MSVWPSKFDNSSSIPGTHVKSRMQSSLTVILTLCDGTGGRDGRLSLELVSTEYARQWQKQGTPGLKQNLRQGPECTVTATPLHVHHMHTHVQNNSVKTSLLTISHAFYLIRLNILGTLMTMSCKKKIQKKNQTGQNGVTH